MTKIRIRILYWLSRRLCNLGNKAWGKAYWLERGSVSKNHFSKFKTAGNVKCTPEYMCDMRPPAIMTNILPDQENAWRKGKTYFDDDVHPKYRKEC